MSATAPAPEAVLAAFPAGTTLFNPVTGEYARVVEHTPERAVGELIAVPGGAVAGPHRHPAQTEHFAVSEGRLGYRLGDRRGELGPGEEMTVPPGVVHDWWNAGATNLRALVTVTPPGGFAAMIGAVWGLAVLGRTNAKGMPSLLDGALLVEAFRAEVLFERPPKVVQDVLARTVAPILRRRGRTVTSLEVLRAAVVDGSRWPGEAAPAAD